MYVCQCEAVTDRQVEGAIAEGYNSLRGLCQALGAGRGCGGCVPTLRSLLCEHCPGAGPAVTLRADQPVIAKGAVRATP